MIGGGKCRRSHHTEVRGSSLGGCWWQPAGPGDTDTDTGPRIVGVPPSPGLQPAGRCLGAGGRAGAPSRAVLCGKEREQGGPTAGQKSTHERLALVGAPGCSVGLIFKKKQPASVCRVPPKKVAPVLPVGQLLLPGRKPPHPHPNGLPPLPPPAPLSPREGKREERGEEGAPPSAPRSLRAGPGPGAGAAAACGGGGGGGSGAGRRRESAGREARARRR